MNKQDINKQKFEGPIVMNMDVKATSLSSNAQILNG